MQELRRLRYLVVLAKRLSYSRAAEDLGLSQSALSRAIQSLERDFGMRLFDRDRAGVVPTEQGRWVVEKAEALLTSAIDFEHQVNFAARGSEGRARFGLTALLATALLPATLTTRLLKTPGFSHEVLGSKPNQPLERLPLS
jgi:DNA-binding transcriptional LysR family regulator